MKALDWLRFLEFQHRQHGKALFRVAELANVAGRDPHALNIESLPGRGTCVRVTLPCEPPVPPRPSPAKESCDEP